MKRQTRSLCALGVLALGAGALGFQGGVEKQTDAVERISEQTLETAFAGAGDIWTGEAPVAVCFTQDIHPKLRRIIQQRLNEIWAKDTANRGDGEGVDFNAGRRWSGAGFGQPMELTWSMPDDGLFIPSQIGEPGGSNILQGWLVQEFGSVEAGKNRFRQVFDAWEDATGIRYTEVSDDNAAFGAAGPHNGGSGRGDIRIVMKNFGFTGILAFNFFPDSGDMVMNGNHRGDFGNSAGGHRFLRNVVAHEHGHGIGLEHVCPQNFSKLMEPAANNNFDMIQHDDTRGGQRMYGDRFENNDTAASAADLGNIPFSIGVSDVGLDANFDNDYYTFDVVSGSQVTLTLAPVGFTYQDWDQLQSGACANSGPIVNSLLVHDLRLRLLNSDGSEVLAERDANGLGENEEILNFVLPSGGTFMVEVDTSTIGVTDVQLYNLSILVEPAQNIVIDLTDWSTVFGTHIEGGLFRLKNSDDNFHVMNSVFGFSAQEPNLVQIIVGAQSSATSLSDLEATIEAKLDNPGGQGTFQLFRWGTQAWETVHTYGIGLDEIVETFNVPTQNRYVRDSDGRIEAQIKHSVVATFSASGFRQSIDQVAYTGLP